MEYKVTRTDGEITDVLNECIKMDEAGKNPWPGMTYAQGVEAGLLWAFGDRDENPIFE